MALRELLQSSHVYRHIRKLPRRAVFLCTFKSAVLLLCTELVVWSDHTYISFSVCGYDCVVVVSI